MPRGASVGQRLSLFAMQPGLCLTEDGDANANRIDVVKCLVPITRRHSCLCYSDDSAIIPA